MKMAAPAASLLAATAAIAGPYPGAAWTPGSTAVGFDEPSILAWSTSVVAYTRGEGVDGAWIYLPEDDLVSGPAGTDETLVASLGRNGSITVGFDRPIADGSGADFAVFENGFSDGFLELGFVEVSQDGTTFLRFPSASLTPAPVGPFQTDAIDPTNLDGLAGKYRLGFGTPFDIGALGLDFVTHVRVVDVTGDGNTTDSAGRPIYDPYPTAESAGFDIDGVAVLNHTMTYAGWLERFFTPAERGNAALAAGDADPDHDGQANLVEYALGGNPVDPTDIGLLQQSATPSGVRQFAFSRLLLKTDIAVAVMGSTDLDAWAALAAGVGGGAFAPVPGSGAGVTEVGSGPLRGVLVDLPGGGGPSHYFSLQVSTP